eukprot:gnl/MRDRNA2_/MRDRNA2_116274_c0_seq1.p1 gnl/MRDRNA2_/MRDRNA2_116274_c0~~gnl/MRDRNA2_/MRDRNA2_116274_c0_seq1.p1  ORF type:complete len:419 (+),score=81.43 gnl/MRDRNA2_/MRDRNA2_116274_c0_seq1:73-1329(+)
MTLWSHSPSLAYRVPAFGSLISRFSPPPFHHGWRPLWTGDIRTRLLRVADVQIPDVFRNRESSAASRVADVLDEVKHLAQLEADKSELLAEMVEERDAELKALYDDEIAGFAQRIEGRSTRLEELLLYLAIEADIEEDLDHQDVFLEVTPGVGGQEAALFAMDLWQMYERLAETRGWSFQVETLRAGDLGEIQHASAIIGGGSEGAYGWLRWESGVHRVQRVPITDSKGKMQTSGACIVVLPMAGEDDITLTPGDVKVEITKKSSGPGGQSVNAAHQAVRITHIATGLSVLCNQSSSQYENRKASLRMLQTRLNADRRAEKLAKEKGERSRQRGGGDRSEKIRTYHYPRDEVIDHRLDRSTVFSVDRVIFGDEFAALVQAHRHQEQQAQIEDAVEYLEKEISAPETVPKRRSAGWKES